MKILLSDLGKRYNREWIFRHLTFEFTPEHRYAITGPNGSGKSTLLQVVSGALRHNEGMLVHELNGQAISVEQLFSLISFASPYLEVPEEFTFRELLSFHFTCKGLRKGYTVDEVIRESELIAHSNKQIRFYSSGMKQRVRLALAFFSDTPLLLLDEPCSNLDQQGIALYHKLIENTEPGRLIIISSNDPQEYATCGQIISMETFSKN